jgi:hypothetical protein
MADHVIKMWETEFWLQNVWKMSPVEDGAINGKNNVKMGLGKLLLWGFGDCNYSGSGPRIVGVVGYWWTANRISE